MDTLSPILREVLSFPAQNKFTDRILPQLIPLAREYSFKRGSFIYSMGERAEAVYILRKGRIKIGVYSDDGREIIKSVLYKESLFGELALVNRNYRNEFARVIDEETLVLSIKISDVRRLMERSADFSSLVLHLIGKRAQKLEQKYESLIFKDARTRVVELLRELSLRLGKPLVNGIMVKHRLTHQELANMAVVSRQKVTETLNCLKSEGSIHFERNMFIVQSLAKLT